MILVDHGHYRRVCLKCVYFFFGLWRLPWFLSKCLKIDRFLFLFSYQFQQHQSSIFLQHTIIISFFFTKIYRQSRHLDKKEGDVMLFY